MHENECVYALIYDHVCQQELKKMEEGSDTAHVMNIIEII